jgi:histidyl-tRNA synthetase
VLEKKGAEEFALRFDLTVPMSRMFVEKQKELAKPVKWFGLSRMWRYEAPQKGRLREFYQLSVELFGSDKPCADAEIINLLISCLKNLGLTSKDAKVKVNNRKLLEGIVAGIVGKKKLDEAIRLIDKSAKLSDDELDAELRELAIAGDDSDAIKEIIKTKGAPDDFFKALGDFKLNDDAKKGLDEMKEIVKMLPEEWIVLDLSVARGLAYYTGTVFECYDTLGKFRAIAGGGRYDNMIELFGGEPCPSTGFGLGYATLYELLKEKNLLPKADFGPDYYVAPVDEKVYPKALEIAEKLRKKASVEVDLMARKLGKQFEYASSIKAKKIVIVGEKDLSQGNVTIRDMTSGKEEKKSLKSL